MTCQACKVVIRNQCYEKCCNLQKSIRFYILITQYFTTDITNSISQIGHKVILLPFEARVPKWQKKIPE